MQRNLLCMFPTNRVVIVFVGSFGLRKSGMKQIFKEVIRNVTYIPPVDWHLLGRCFVRREPPVMGTMISMHRLAGKSNMKQFSKASGLKVQGNHSWVFPDIKSHSTCVCLFPPPPLHLPLFWKMSRYNLCKKRVFPCLSCRAAGYEKERHQNNCMVIKC